MSEYVLYPVDAEVVRNKKKRSGGNHHTRAYILNALYRFIISDAEAVEVRELTGFHSNSNNMRKCFADAIKEERMPIDVIIRGDHVYLIKRPELLAANEMCKMMCGGEEE